MKKIIKKKTNKTTKKEDNPFVEVTPSSVPLITPSENYIVRLSTEDTKFLVTFRNDQVVQCTTMDGKYETIVIPISQFNRRKYTFEYEDEEGVMQKVTSLVTVYKEE